MHQLLTCESKVFHPPLLLLTLILRPLAASQSSSVAQSRQNSSWDFQIPSFIEMSG